MEGGNIGFPELLLMLIGAATVLFGLSFIIARGIRLGWKGKDRDNNKKQSEK